MNTRTITGTIVRPSEAFWLNALLTRLSTPPAPPAQPE